MGFEFRKKRVFEFDIAGNHFEISATQEIMKRLHDFEENAKNTQINEDNLDDVIEFLRKAIDATLGDGASEKIFNGRPDDLFDYIDVVRYIQSEVETQRTAMLKEYNV